MSKPLAVTFAKLAIPKSGTLVLLAGDKGALGDFAASVDAASSGTIAKALKAAKFAGKSGHSMAVWTPPGLSLSRIVVAGYGKSGERDENDWLKLGGALMAAASGAELGPVHVALEAPQEDRKKSDGAAALGAREAALIALGMRLRSYAFDKYKTSKRDEDGSASDEEDAGNGAAGDKKAGDGVEKAVLCVASPAAARRAFAPLKEIGDGVFLARDLVNEPANVLGPLEFAAKAKELEKLGVAIEVLTEKEMKKLKMHALLGVSLGSPRPPRLVVMRWNGASKKSAEPVAFVGKGVVFDTGGISLKPPAGMEDMKGDMGGAAAVVGLMRALAGRKAKVNAIGIIGLVENMPDGKAQRPGDIVTSMSGQTIEILNTDAEGRLVLADALWYCQERFKPRFIVDLATLTGAILVALGKQHAGLFSNNDELAERLFAAGQASGEKVWRLPLAKEYDKLIDAKFADVKNTGGRYAGSITAAQFLQRFVNKTPWAHLDIAGTAMAAPQTEINRSWGSGFGVRLLDRLVADNYED